MGQFFYNLWSRFLTWFGKLKIMPSANHLPVIVQDVQYKVDGNDILQIMEFIQPGDVLLRGYDRYVDGKFIPDEKGYSHAGMYIGGNMVIHAVSPSVQKTSIIDFCQADRIMVLRPHSGMMGAIVKAHELVGVPYDFNYESDIGRLYCFELIATCYEDSNMQKFAVKKFFGLLKRNCYLAKSIYGNEFFVNLFEKNDK